MVGFQGHVPNYGLVGLGFVVTWHLARKRQIYGTATIAQWSSEYANIRKHSISQHSTIRGTHTSRIRVLASTARSGNA